MTGKIRQVGALVKKFRSFRFYQNDRKKTCLSDRQFFLFALPGIGLWAARLFAIAGSFATEAEIWQSLGQIMIFGFAGNDLANDPALTPANFSLPRQKYSTTKKWQQRLRRGESTQIFFYKDCTDTNT